MLDEELSSQEELNKLKREASKLDAERNVRAREVIKEQMALGKSLAQANEYLKKQDTKYKEIVSQISSIKSSMKEYQDYATGIATDLARQEESLSSLTGIQSSIADGERVRLEIQNRMTSVSSEFHDVLSEIGDTTQDLSDLTAEESVSRSVALKQGQEQISFAREMIDAERARHQEVINNYDSEFVALQEKIREEQSAYDASINQQQSLAHQRTELDAQRISAAEELAQVQEQLTQMPPDQWGPWVDHLVQRAEELSGKVDDISNQMADVDLQNDGVNQTIESFNELKSRADDLTHSYQASVKFLEDELPLMEQAVKTAEENFKTAEDLSSLTQKQKEFLEEQIELYDGIGSAIAKVLETASLLFSGLKGFFAASFIGAGMLVDKITEVNKTLGMSLSDTNAFSLSIMGLGMVFDDAQETAEGLASQLGGMEKASFGLQLKTNLIASNLGIAGEEAATLVGSFSRLNAGSTSVALDMMKSTKETAKLAGVIPSKVMKDLANNTEAFALYGKQGGKNIAEAAVYAAKLGVSMDKLAGVADKLLDFESSITEELELSAMLGRSINLDRARQLAYEGDIQGAVNETLNQLGGIEAFNQMDYYQKKQTAELLGVSVAELQQMAENQKNVNQKVGLMQQGFDTASSALEYFNSSLLGQTLKGLGGAITVLGQVGTGLSALGVDSKKIFGSIFSFIKSPFVGVKKAVSSVSSSISGLFKKDEEGRGFFARMKDGFKSIFGGKKGDGIPKPEMPGGTSISESAKGVDKVAKGGKELEKTKSIGDKLKDLAKGLQAMGTTKVLAGALNLVPTGLGFLLMLPGIPTLFLLSKMDISSVGKGLGSLGKGLEKLGSIKVLFGAINLIPIGIGFALMTLGMIGMGLIALLGIPLGAGLTAMSVGLTAMGNPAVFMGALGILAVGAALIPFTFALSLLKGVDIGVILSTVGALVVFGLAAAAIGSVLPLIAMGALGIGLIGLSLIPFTFGLSLLQGVDIGVLFSTAAALVVFGIAAAGIGFISPLILMGSAAIATLGLSLIPFTFAMSQLQGVDPTILITAAVALGIFGVSAAAIGAASLLILVGAGVISVFALSLIPFTYALSLLKGVDPSILTSTAIALSMFGVIAAGLGALSPLIIMGSVAVSLMSLSLMLFTSAMARLQGVDPEILTSTAIALGTFGAIAAGFGALSPLIIMGSVAIAVLSLALIPFTSAMSKLTEIDTTVLETIVQSMMGIATASFMISAGLALATVALIGLVAITPILLIASVALSIFGGTLMLTAMASSILAATLPIVSTSLNQMVGFTEGILGLSEAILKLSASMASLSFASLMMVPLLPVLAVVGAVSSLFGGGGGEEGGAGEESSTLSTLESTVKATSEALLMEIKGLREDLNSGKISVNMDGDRVTSKIVTNINRSATNGYGIR